MSPKPAFNLRTREGMAQWILNVEARRDKEGRLRIYKLPRGDGGGSFEVAGLNDLYHPDAAKHAADLIRAGRDDTAELMVRDYIAEYTDCAQRWAWEVPAVEFFLRDCVWNRGPRGAAKILQMTLGFKVEQVDGWVGRQTMVALLSRKRGSYHAWIMSLRREREEYERRVAPPVGAREKFWKGLVNRWNAAEEAALDLL